MCKYCQDGDYPCEDYEYWDDSENPDWDLEGSNNQSEPK
jgi:hypothetical protein